MKRNDEDYMQRAVFLAQKGRGKTSPNPLVGAVLVRNGRIVGEGWHRSFGGPHAEIEAFRNAGVRSRGATLYVTLEPCAHDGKTPPCVDAVIKSGVNAVVIAMKDPNPLVNGKSIRRLRGAGIRVRTGVFEKEAKALNRSFEKYMKTGWPLVTAKTAQTLDGKIALPNGRSQWITSVESRAVARSRRKEFDAIVVGVNTVLKDDPNLGAGSSSRLKKIIVDSFLKTPVSSRLFRDTRAADCILAATAGAEDKRVNRFRRRGHQVWIGPSKNGKVSLRWLMKKLADEGMINILLEGGAELIGTALREKLVDRMIIFIAPKIIGDQAALSSVRGLKTSDVNRTVHLTGIRQKTIGSDIVLEGEVKYPA